MNTHVDFETAKLLKEKGYNEEVRDYYGVKDGVFYHSQYFRDNISINEKHKGFIIAPTIAEVVMWLYEKHGIWICVREYPSDGFYYLIKGINNIYVDRDTPTKAYQEAINYVLTNLI